ncbi:MAG TPA: DNA polymerase Y family protein [Pseudomonadales bacterium]|nr:DNA polymerase Y family protein [Pseudomonadales bacterium]
MPQPPDIDADDDRSAGTRASGKGNSPAGVQADRSAGNAAGGAVNTTGLWLCLHLPRLGLELFTRSLPDGAVSRPVVLVAAHRVLQVNAAGRARGLRVDMSLATAESICADLAVAWRDEVREAAVLQRLAYWAYRFTPRVSPAPPSDLLLEVAGSLRLFRGLDRLQRRILDGVSELGYSALPGLAPTPLAAQALARAGRSPDPEALAQTLEFEGRGDDALRSTWCTAVAKAARPALAHMPLHFLARPAAELDRIEALGLERLGELLRLPRAPLGRRFGQDLLDHLERMTGRRPDPREAVVPPDTFSSTVHFLEDLEHKSALAFPMQRLLGELADWLRLRQKATDRLDWRLIHPNHGEQQIRVQFAVPQRDRVRMLEYSRLQLEREGSHPAVATLMLEVTRLTDPGARVDGLFPNMGASGDDDARQDPALLVDLLRARLGPDVCRSVLPADDHRPEHAWKPVRPVPPGSRSAKQNRASAGRARDGGAGGRTRASGARAESTRADAAAEPDGDSARTSAETSEPLAPGPRPLWLLERPRPLTARDDRPFLRGPLTLCRGPERIDVGWWEDAAWMAAAGLGRAPEASASRSPGEDEDIDGQHALDLGAGPPERRNPDSGTAGESAVRSGHRTPEPAPGETPAREPGVTLPSGGPPPPARDYWVARHRNGSHLWVFREADEGRWYLHGYFS